MKKSWWKESVVYQIYPRSFCDSNGDGIGDLRGIISKLDYLKELGIDVIWLSPVYRSPNDDNGYDISDYEDIMEEFGTMADFDELLKEAHDRGIKIVMDLVVNHSSDEHAWFMESRKDRENLKRDFYIWRKGRKLNEVSPEEQACLSSDVVEYKGEKLLPPNNWGSYFSGSAWVFDEKTGEFYLHLFSKKQPDLNWENEAVRKEVFEMMSRWCEKGIDGFRMDVISLISKPKGLPNQPIPKGAVYGDSGAACANGPKVHTYLQEMNEKVLSRYDIMTVGETAGVTLEEAKRYANSEGTELNMVFQFEHMDLDGSKKHGFKWATEKMPLVPLKKNLAKWQNGLHELAWNSLYLCNHDQPRIVSRLGEESGVLRERSAKCIATFLHMMQGTPYIYQGEELGMVNYPFSALSEFRDLESINAFSELTEKLHLSMEELFPLIAHKSRDNARTPMQWDDTKEAGFTSGKPWIAVNPNYKEINAKEELGRADSVFHYYQKLIQLRHQSELIVYGDFHLLEEEDPDLFIYERSLGKKKLLCVCNVSENTRSYSIPEEFLGGKVLIQNIEGQDAFSGELAPYEAFVLEV